MSKKRRAFSTEYKREAVKLVTEQGYSVAQASACWAPTNSSKKYNTVSQG